MDKPLLVFLHGGGVSSWMWDRQVKYFKNYKCLVLDLPGHGKCDEGYNFSIKDIANQVVTIIEEHRAEQEVNVIGFSLGAQILISMLSENNHLIDKAVIICSSTMQHPLPKLIAHITT